MADTENSPPIEEGSTDPAVTLAQDAENVAAAPEPELTPEETLAAQTVEAAVEETVTEVPPSKDSEPEASTEAAADSEEVQASSAGAEDDQKQQHEATAEIQEPENIDDGKPENVDGEKPENVDGENPENVDGEKPLPQLAEEEANYDTAEERLKQATSSGTKLSELESAEETSEETPDKEEKDTQVMKFLEEASVEQNLLNTAASISAALRKQREEEGWLSTLDVEAILSRKNAVDTYTHACEELGIVPTSFFAKRITSPQIVMRYHGVGPKGSQAISQVLLLNKSIQHLDLTGNCCGEGGAYIAQSLNINSTLVHLDLSQNLLKKNGGKEFAEMLTENSTLKTLILKGAFPFSLNI